jgi:hypothetical protein
MADDVRISGPVAVESGSKERVAFDLMNKIASHEGSDERSKRDYWFKLFHQCMNATYGYDLKSIHKDD